MENYELIKKIIELEEKIEDLQKSDQTWLVWLVFGLCAICFFGCLICTIFCNDRSDF